MDTQTHKKVTPTLTCTIKIMNWFGVVEIAFMMPMGGAKNLSMLRCVDLNIRLSGLYSMPGQEDDPDRDGVCCQVTCNTCATSSTDTTSRYCLRPKRLVIVILFRKQFL